MPEPSLPAEPRTLGRGSKRVAMTGRCSGVGSEVLHGVATDIVPAPDGPEGFDTHGRAPPTGLSCTRVTRAARPPPARGRRPRVSARGAAPRHAPTPPTPP